MRRFMAMLALSVLGGTLLATPAPASPYWVVWEDGWPEQQGWARFYSPGMPAKRWLEDGKLFIDSRESFDIYDYVVRDMQGRLDPPPGTVFVFQWRVRILSVIGYWDYDQGVGVHSDAKRSVAFEFGERGIRSVLEPGLKAPLAPGVFHDFELRSADMRAYELYIDGGMAMQGFFRPTSDPSVAYWGDVSYGAAASLVEWDWVRFGAVPETTTVVGVGACALCMVLRKNR